MKNVLKIFFALGLVIPTMASLAQTTENQPIAAELDGSVLQTWYRDMDGDGFGRSGMSMMAETKPAGYVATPGDCNDMDATVYPGAPELCDGKDNDCNGVRDDGAPGSVNWYPDNDGDGFGNAGGMVKVACRQPAGYVTNVGDCKDMDPSVYPGAPEICDGKDNDCNGLKDDGAPGTITWYRDEDGDGFGTSMMTKVACIQPMKYVAVAGDCRDMDATVYPGAPELCDGKDNDCNGLKDDTAPGSVTWYRDADGDGYGKASMTKIACIPPAGYVLIAGDCVDMDPAINAGATEICGDMKDNDCDGMKDEGCGPVTEPVQMHAGVNLMENFAAAPKEIALSPNPASGVLMVTLNGFEAGKKVEMQLVQADGKAVMAQSMIPSVPDQQVRLDVRKMNAGFYMLQVKQGITQQTKKVMIVQ